MRLRVLAAEVDVALLAARGIGGDRHRLDQRERVALHHHAVLEGSRLRLVGVADQIVGPGRLPCHRLPLDAGREGGAAASLQLRVLDLADDALGPELERTSQRRVAAVCPVVVQAGGIDGPDTAEQAQAALARLRHLGNRFGPRLPAGEQGEHPGRARGRDDVLLRALAGDRQHRGRGAIALAETGAAIPGRGAVFGQLALAAEALLQLGDQLLRAVAAAGDVLADVDDPRRPRVDGEQRVEGGDTVGVGRRDRQPRADVVQAARADPADPLLQRPQCRQQQMATAAGIVPPAGGVACGPAAAVAALPAALRRAEDGVDGGALGGRFPGPRDEMEIH